MKTSYNLKHAKTIECETSYNPKHAKTIESENFITDYTMCYRSIVYFKIVSKPLRNYYTIIRYDVLKHNFIALFSFLKQHKKCNFFV